MSEERTQTQPYAIVAEEAPPTSPPSNYPPEFATRVEGRVKKRLGDLFGLKNFGVNLTRLAPGAISALHHRHAKQDEFVYVLEGEATLYCDGGERTLGAGMCAGFPAGGTAHHLANHGTRDVVYLEIGDRTPGDSSVYPDDDIAVTMGPDGRWRFTRKDGSAF